MRRATLQMEEKEKLLSQLEAEKREFQRKFETIEFNNFELQEKLTQAEKQVEQKDQDKMILEEDGIKCFDLEQQSELRLSLSSVSGGDKIVTQTIDESLALWKELEKVKREKQELELLLEKAKSERETESLGKTLWISPIRK